MRWLRAAWTDASRVQKILIVVAALLAVGAISTIASPGPSASESLRRQLMRRPQLPL
jgi:hypothetical protein